MKRRWTKPIAYAFMLAFVFFTTFLAFNPTSNSSSFSATIAPYRSRFSNLISHYFPSSTSSSDFVNGVSVEGLESKNLTEERPSSLKGGILERNSTGSEAGPLMLKKGGILIAENSTSVQIHGKNSSGSGVAVENKGVLKTNIEKNGTGSIGNEVASVQIPAKNSTGSGVAVENKGNLKTNIEKNQTGSTGNEVTSVQIPGKNSSGSGAVVENKGILKTNIKKNETGSTGDEVTSVRVSGKNSTGRGVAVENKGILKTNIQKNETGSTGNEVTSVQIPGKKNSIGSGVAVDNKGIFKTNIKKNETGSTGNEVTSNGNGVVVPRAELKNQTTGGKPHNLESEKVHGGSNSTLKEMEDLLKGMVDCDIFHGKWVYDDSYPLYSEGSCPHIDEPFDCFLNGRPDRAYQKLRWQPDSCKIPRFNAIDLLQRLRGKRLAFVGDSLNRNMWESLVCVLWNSVKDKKRVVEAFGRHEFRTEGSYSFLFKDYNCTVEFFRSPFLVQEWEVPDSNGMKKETLRLDIIERSSSGYKDANIIVFNTGHWWTHEKTAKGRDYYQEGNRVYSELNVVEAFHKALHTWALWVDANVDHKKTLVVFRGYSASHFRGGQWNSGGACDRETEPITNESFLSPYPPKMRVLETVLNGMKTRVSYLNITRMTDFRKDAHPSVYRKQNLTDEERREPERFQDCSHWCLPGVPDSWNELLYAQILIKQNQTPNW